MQHLLALWVIFLKFCLSVDLNIVYMLGNSRVRERERKLLKIPFLLKGVFSLLLFFSINLNMHVKHSFLPTYIVTIVHNAPAWTYFTLTSVRFI